MNADQIDELYAQMDRQNESLARHVNRHLAAMWVAITALVVTVVLISWLSADSSTSPPPNSEAVGLLNNIPGVQAVAASSASDTTPAPKSAIAKCPLGNVLLSGGYALAPADAHLRVSQSGPDGNAWTVVANADADAPDELAWGVTAMAICAGPS